MNPALGIVLAVVLVAVNAFFVTAEFALVAVRRSQIEPLAATSRRARRTLAAMERLTLMLAGAQVGITVCSVLLGAVAEPAVSHLLSPVLEWTGLPEGAVHPVSFILAMLVIVGLHVVLGEMVPKNVALSVPMGAAMVLVPVLEAFVGVVKPLIVALNVVANRFVRLLGVTPKDELAAAYTRQEVAALVEESLDEGLLEADEYDRLAGALGFTEKTIDLVTLPLDSLATVPSGASPADVEQVCADTGYSRFPVAGGGGELLGYLHIKDVLTDEERRTRPIEDKWVRPFAVAAQGELLHDVLEKLQRKGAHMARVVTPSGETVGLATLEDLIEELVGEIRDASH